MRPLRHPRLYWLSLTACLALWSTGCLLGLTGHEWPGIYLTLAGLLAGAACCSLGDDRREE